MKNRYTKQFTAMGLFAVALWTAACGGGTNTPTATDKGPIQIWTMEDSTAFTALMQDFTTKTGIPVQVEAVPGGKRQRKPTPARAAGNGTEPMQTRLVF